MFKKRSFTLPKTGNVLTSSTGHILSDGNHQDGDDEPERNVNKAPCIQRLRFKPFLGLIYSSLWSLFIMLTSIIVKKLNYIDPGQLSFVRNAGIFAGSLPIAVYSVKNILGPRKDIIVLLVRSFAGCTALYLNLLAYRYLPLAEAAVLMSTIPALVTLLARLYLKEPCGWMQALAIFLTVLGVLLSIRIPELIKHRVGLHFTASYILGLACAIGCVLILSVTFIVLRKMKDIHFAVVLGYFGMIGMIENTVLTASFSVFAWARCGWDVFLVLMVGVLGFIGHIFFILAIQVEAVGLVSVMKSSVDIVAALIFQVIFFEFSPDLYNVGGALLVILSMVIIGGKKWLITLPEDNPTRKRMKFLLQ